MKTMVFVKHVYGSFKKEIKLLLRKRLIVREKIRYYNNQLDNYLEQEILLDKKIEEQLEIAKQ